LPERVSNGIRPANSRRRHPDAGARRPSASWARPLRRCARRYPSVRSPWTAWRKAEDPGDTPDERSAPDFRAFARHAALAQGKAQHRQARQPLPPVGLRRGGRPQPV